MKPIVYINLTLHIHTATGFTVFTKTTNCLKVKYEYFYARVQGLNAMAGVHFRGKIYQRFGLRLAYLIYFVLVITVNLDQTK